MKKSPLGTEKTTKKPACPTWGAGVDTACGGVAFAFPGTGVAVAGTVVAVAANVGVFSITVTVATGVGVVYITVAAVKGDGVCWYSGAGETQAELTSMSTVDTVLMPRRAILPQV